MPRGFCKGTCAVSLSEVFFHRVSVLRIDQAAVTVTWYAMMPRARAHKITAARDAAREACPLMQRKRRRWYLRRGLLNQPCSVPKLQRRDVTLAILFLTVLRALISATSCALGSSARGSQNYTSTHPPCVAVAPKRRATSLLPKSSHQPTHSSAARRLGGGCGSDPSTGGLEVGTQGRFSCLLSSPTKPRRRQPHVLGSLEPSKLAQRIRRGNAGALDVRSGMQILLGIHGGSG